MMTDDVVAQLEAHGAPPEVIEAARSRNAAVAPVDDAFEVWPENWTSVSLFLNLESQWDIVSGMGGFAYVGIKYEVVPEQMDRLRIPRRKRPEFWDDLALMERTALPLKNK
ncbi:MAG: DUF1799 domain-containing protein [Telluria sp.]